MGKLVCAWIFMLLAICMFELSHGHICVHNCGRKKAINRFKVDFRGYNSKQFIRDALRRAQSELRRKQSGFADERINDIGRDAEEQFETYDVRDYKRALK